MTEITETISTEWPELIVECDCIRGLAGIYHYKDDTCPVNAFAEPDKDDLNAAVAKGMAKRGRPPKDDTELEDKVSAGRKRAAAKLKLETLPKGYVCEWALLRFAGGGVNPIKGCPGYPPSDLHHGPDKSTLNNSRPYDGDDYNLHYICDHCHNRWHAANDEFYGELGGDDRPEDNSEWVPKVDYQLHNPTDKMTKQEAYMVEMMRDKESKSS